MSKTGKIFLLLGGILLALVIVAIVGIIYAARSMGKPNVADNSVLVLNVSGDCPIMSPKNRSQKRSESSRRNRLQAC